MTNTPGLRSCMAEEKPGMSEAEAASVTADVLVDRCEVVIREEHISTSAGARARTSGRDECLVMILCSRLRAKERC